MAADGWWPSAPSRVLDCAQNCRPPSRRRPVSPLAAAAAATVAVGNRRRPSACSIASEAIACRRERRVASPSMGAVSTTLAVAALANRGPRPQGGGRVLHCGPPLLDQQPPLALHCGCCRRHRDRRAPSATAPRGHLALMAVTTLDRRRTPATHPWQRRALRHEHEGHQECTQWFAFYSCVGEVMVSSRYLKVFLWRQICFEYCTVLLLP